MVFFELCGNRVDQKEKFLGVRTKLQSFLSCDGSNYDQTLRAQKGLFSSLNLAMNGNTECD